MQLNIITRKVTVSYLEKQDITQKLKSSLSHFESQVHSALLTVTDVNGPKGGKDMLCKIRLKIAGIPSILIQEKNESLWNAIDGAIRRTKQTLKRKIGRSREFVNRNLLVSTASEPDVVAEIQTR
jgi:putative sigma-54 modulation protein